MDLIFGRLPFGRITVPPWFAPHGNEKYPSHRLLLELQRLRGHYNGLFRLAQQARATNHITVANLLQAARQAMAEKFAGVMPRVPLELREHQRQLLDFLAEENLLAPHDAMFAGSGLFEGWHVAGIFESLGLPFYTTDADGLLDSYNQAAATLWGWRPDIGRQRWCGSWKIYTPGGGNLPHNQCPMAQCIEQKAPIRGQSAVAERPDGARIPFKPFPSPLIDAAGNFVGAINVLLDISEDMHVNRVQA